MDEGEGRLEQGPPSARYWRSAIKEAPVGRHLALGDSLLDPVPPAARHQAGPEGQVLRNGQARSPPALSGLPLVTRPVITSRSPQSRLNTSR